MSLRRLQADEDAEQDDDDLDEDRRPVLLLGVLGDARKDHLVGAVVRPSSPSSILTMARSAAIARRF